MTEVKHSRLAPARRELYGVVRILHHRTTDPEQRYTHAAPCPAGRDPRSEWRRRPELSQRRIFRSGERVRAQRRTIGGEVCVGACAGGERLLPNGYGALRQAVRANRRTFGQSVARLRGKAEMHLKVLVRDGVLRDAMADVALPDTVGGEYLIKLREKAAKDRERQTKARALSVQVHKLFNPLEEEISCKRVDSNGMLIDIAHLIDSKSVEKYQNRYSSAAKQLKNCELLISGPWPPYHFLPGKLRTVAGNS
jgi:Gas vesicle synthesis protein GvpL/GvpF